MEKTKFSGGGAHLGRGLSHVHSCGFAKFEGLPLKLLINELKINTPMHGWYYMKKSKINTLMRGWYYIN